MLFNQIANANIFAVSFFLWTGQYGKTLDFNQRLEIAIDVAHGLTYLHLYAGENFWTWLIVSKIINLSSRIAFCYY